VLPPAAAVVDVDDAALDPVAAVDAVLDWLPLSSPPHAAATMASATRPAPTAAIRLLLTLAPLLRRS
jgi:hypothetical protein